MKFICYPKCKTCQKAKKWLDEREIEYETRDIKEKNPSYHELKKWFAASGLPLKRFFNTSGWAYKSLNLKDKLPAMKEDECLKLLGTDGMLIKRPLLIAGETVLVNFVETEWEKALERVMNS
ncbi:MAG: arsenate reductase family protein [Synergistaceae bacterium]|jgi:arsenate reductase|nr:arsenate reductase family protein [Synergistaceae bacterium]